MLHVSVGIFLWRVYPKERVDNFFIYEQFLINVIWFVFNSHLLFFLGISNGNTYHILTLVLQISQPLQIMFELTLPLYIIQKYGYHDAPKVSSSSSDTSIVSDRFKIKQIVYVHSLSILTKSQYSSNGIVIRPGLERTRLVSSPILPWTFFSYVFGWFV